MLKAILDFVRSNRIANRLYYSKLTRFILNPVRRLYYRRIDVSNLSDEILNVVESSELKLSPIFGTLLMLHRDGLIKKADDYDFVLGNSKMNPVDVIDKLECVGMKFISFSLVGNNNKLVELSFNYRGARVDIFYFDFFNDKSAIHSCPNFRTGTATPNYYSKGITEIQYDSFFQVLYKDFNLSEKGHLLYPDMPESFFETHYGIDWRTPKEKDFIDYKHYTFVKESSSVYIGESRRLKSFLEELIDA